MVCEMQVLPRANSLEAWTFQQFADKLNVNDEDEMDVSTDDDAPSILSLARDITITEYNDDKDHEWVRPVFATTHSSAPAIIQPMQPVPASPLLTFTAAPQAQLASTLTQTSRFDPNGTEEVPVAELHISEPMPQTLAVEVTPLEKELRKVQKKLHTMMKLQEQLDAGETLDKLQIVKLGKRVEVEAEVARLNQLIVEEKANQSKPQRWEQPHGVQAPLVNFVVPPVLMNSTQQATSDWAPLDVRLSTSQLSEWLSASAESQEMALRQLHGRVCELAFDPNGCRVIQQAFQVAANGHTTSIAAELHKSVLQAVQSPHGNYVMQRVVESLPTATSRFVGKELIGSANVVARHRYGCRVLCRLFENCSGEPEVLQLGNELIRDVKNLARDVFAHHVIQALIQHGVAEQKQRAVELLAPHVVEDSQNRSASYVLETAILYGSPMASHMIAARILHGGAHQVEALARNQQGNRVLKALYNTQGAFSQDLARALHKCSQSLMNNKQGRRLLGDLRFSPVHV